MCVYSTIMFLWITSPTIFTLPDHYPFRFIALCVVNDHVIPDNKNVRYIEEAISEIFSLQNR